MAGMEDQPELVGAPPVVGKKVITEIQARDFVAEQKKRGIVRSYAALIPHIPRTLLLAGLLVAYPPLHETNHCQAKIGKIWGGDTRLYLP
jgi:hypothetical protein